MDRAGLATNATKRARKLGPFQSEALVTLPAERELEMAAQTLASGTKSGWWLKLTETTNGPEDTRMECNEDEQCETAAPSIHSCPFVSIRGSN